MLGGPRAHGARRRRREAVELKLPFELRQKSRLRTALEGGEEVALLLPRGEVLRGGDCLRPTTAVSCASWRNPSG